MAMTSNSPEATTTKPPAEVRTAWHTKRIHYLLQWVLLFLILQTAMLGLLTLKFVV
jgi:hypothetical protein